MTKALLIIDVQNAILSGKAAPARQPQIDAALNETVARLRILKESAAAAGVPVVLIQHETDRPTGRRRRARPGSAVARGLRAASCETAYPPQPCPVRRAGGRGADARSFPASARQDFRPSAGADACIGRYWTPLATRRRFPLRDTLSGSRAANFISTIRWAVLPFRKKRR